MTGLLNTVGITVGVGVKTGVLCWLLADPQEVISKHNNTIANNGRMLRYIGLDNSFILA